MTRCEGAWKQVLWLWEKSWPDVDGMGEEDESATVNRFGSGATRRSTGNAVAGAPGRGDERDAEAASDDDDVVEVGRRESGLVGSPSYVSPYGGTGLQAVEAANHA